MRTPNLLFRRRSLIIVLLALVIVFILWNVPQLAFLTYPVRLFVTYVHEAGHSLVTLLTGGEVVGFLVSPDGSGLAATRGGNRALIIPAGYLGAAFFGAALFYLIHTLRYSRAIAAALGVGLIAFTLAFARPDEQGLPVALVVGVLSGAALLGMAWKASRDINLLVLNVLAMMTALNAVFDVFSLIRASDAARGAVANDAASFSQQVAPFLPAAVWAFIWAVLAVVMLLLSAYWSVLRLFRRSRE